MILSLNGKVLAILLLVSVICGILLTPLGVETRGSEVLSSVSSLLWLGLALGTFILTIVSLILVFFRSRVASILATIGSIGAVLVLVGDQAGLVSSIRPPPPVTVVEIIAILVNVSVIFFASRVYGETRPPSSA